MSSIRLSGSTSGYYDLTVPAAAGTNSIDLSNLPVKDSNGNLGIGTSSPSQKLHVESAGANYITTRDSTSGGIAGLICQNGSDTRGIRINNANLELFDFSAGAARMILDGSGRVTTPYQPRFLAVPTGNASVGYSSQKHIYTATAYNVGSHYDTSNGRFTAPIGGFYWFEHRMAMSGGTSSTLEAKIYVNGSEFARSYLDYNGSTNTDRVQTIIQLSAGDYVESWTHWASTNLNNYLAQGGGATQNAITCFMGALVG